MRAHRRDTAVPGRFRHVWSPRQVPADEPFGHELAALDGHPPRVPYALAPLVVEPDRQVLAGNLQAGQVHDHRVAEARDPHRPAGVGDHSEPRQVPAVGACLRVYRNERSVISMRKCLATRKRLSSLPTRRPISSAPGSGRDGRATAAAPPTMRTPSSTGPSTPSSPRISRRLPTIVAGSRPSRKGMSASP